ncbi:MAG TPA: hypothetical protein VM470_02940 [Acidimicrobiia bacterium]|nr:hypothetical protein [Acidimicrobiia bacterium]
MRIKLIVALAIALMLAACDAGKSDDLASTLKLMDDPGSILLMVTDEGGFVPADFLVNRGPRLVLLRDGTLIAPGAVPAIYPGPMLTPYQQVSLDEETMLFVMEELDALGFVDISDETNNEAANFIADASITVVTFHNRDGAHSFGVYALGIGDIGPGTGFTDARVPQLANLLNELDQAAFSVPGEIYDPDTIQVLAGILEFPVEADFANVRDWPLPVSYEDMGQTDLATWRCATFEGGEADRLLTEFSQANQVTTWDDGSTEYSMAARPLLPGEEACAPLGPAA